MATTRSRVLGCALVAVSLLLLALIWRRELEFEGEPLSSWITQLEPWTDANGPAERAIRQLGPAKVIPVLLNRARRADSLYRRIYESQWRFQDLVDRILPAPPDPELEKVQFALSLLGPSAVPQLTAAFQDPNVIVRTTAICAIGAMGVKAEQAIPALIHALESTNEGRYSALLALRQMGPKRTNALPAFVQALHDVKLREEAAVALGELGAQAQAAAPELGRLLHDPTVSAHASLGLALWRINGDTNVIAVLAADLEKPNQVYLWPILWALRQIGPEAKPAIPAILRLVTNPARKQFTSACWQALLRIDPDAQEAIPAWRQLLQDEQLYTREQATLALRRLTGRTNEGSESTHKISPLPYSPLPLN